MAAPSAPNVLQLITSSDRRGAEVFALDLEDALREDGFVVATAALVRGTGADCLEVPVLGRRRLDGATLARIRRAAARADVVVAHGSTTLPASVIATLGAGVPIVYRSIGDLAAWNTSRVRRLRTSALLRRAATVVALTDRAAEGVIGFGVPATRVRVIPNGVVEARYPVADQGARARARAELGIEVERLAAVVGALEPEKDVATAIRATAAIEDLHLVVAGSGSRRDDLERIAHDLAPGRVHFLGRVASSSTVLTAADLLVLPSLTEGMPGVVIEAALTGIPAVASDVGFVADAVIEGDTGFLVAPGDVCAFTRAISDSLQARDRLGAAARRVCEQRFGMRSVGPMWGDVLREQLG